MRFNIYTVWMDPVFYSIAAGFAAALFLLIYSIKRYVELKNEIGFEEAEEAEEAFAGMPSPDITARTRARLALRPDEVPVSSSCAAPVVSGGAQPHGCCEDAPKNRAEVFVKGIYEGISGLDARFRNIESALSKSRVNSEFAVKFLEDILADLGSLDKEKIKARIEYLLSDLKK